MSLLRIVTVACLVAILTEKAVGEASENGARIIGNVGDSADLPCAVDESKCGKVYYIMWSKKVSSKWKRVYVYTDDMQKAEQELANPDRARFYLEEDKAFLRISTLRAKDGGTYMCDVTYEQGICPTLTYSNLITHEECGMSRNFTHGHDYTFDNLKTYDDQNGKDFPRCVASDETSRDSNEMERILEGFIPESASAMPWIAELRIRYNGKTLHICGGAILTEYFVLTAAHCVDEKELLDLPLSDVFVRVGEFDQEKIDVAEVNFEIEKILRHPEYNKGQRLNFDIALLKIKTRGSYGIQFNDYSRPICLPTAETPYETGAIAYVAGWGLTNEREETGSRYLRLATVPLVSADDCNKFHGRRITPNMMCAGHHRGGSDACDGDSGGPLVATINGRTTLLGIVSWGQECGRKPGVYANVQFVLPWIWDAMNTIC